MMNCMGQGAAATEMGGIRIADWALAIAYLLIGLLFVIGIAAVVRTFLALWRGEPVERSREAPATLRHTGDGGLP